MKNLLSPTDIHQLPIFDQATLGVLPEYLSVKEIAILLYSAETEQQYSKNALKCLKTTLTNSLIEACETKQLTYEGNIKGWIYTDTNPYPLARNGLFISYRDPKLYMDFIRISVASTPIDTVQQQTDKDQIPKSDIKADYYACSPGDCTIHKSEVEHFLKERELWPVANCLLAKWWVNDAILCNTPDSINMIHAAYARRI